VALFGHPGAAAYAPSVSPTTRGMMRIDRWLIALASLAGPMLVPAPAAACGSTPIIERPTLTPLAEVQEQLAWAEQVFLGRVADRDDENTTFSVEAYWKGTGAPTYIVGGGSTLPDGTQVISDCDFGFVANTRYVVFAHRTSRGLTASSCSMTRPVDQAGELIRLLDRAVPRQSVRPPERSDLVLSDKALQPTKCARTMG
jgi:hypothetical protein